MMSGGFPGLCFSALFDVTTVLRSHNFKSCFFSCFWIELPLIMADKNGISNECVVRLMIEDIVAYLQLSSGKKDAWYLQTSKSWELTGATFTERMLRWVCLPLSVYLKNWVITVTVNCCWCFFVFFMYVYFLYCIAVRIFNASVEKKSKRMSSFEITGF